MTEQETPRRTNDSFGYERWFVGANGTVAHLVSAASAPRVLCGHVIHLDGYRADPDVYTCLLCVRAAGRGGFG